MEQPGLSIGSLGPRPGSARDFPGLRPVSQPGGLLSGKLEGGPDSQDSRLCLRQRTARGRCGIAPSSQGRPVPRFTQKPPVTHS